MRLLIILLAFLLLFAAAAGAAPEFYYNETNAEQSTTSTTHIAASLLNVTPPSADDYAVIVTGEFRQSGSTSDQVLAKLEIDGTEHDNSSYRPQDATNWFPFIFSRNISLSAAPHLINVSFASSSSARTVMIRNVHMLAGSFDLDAYNETNSVSSTSSASYVNITNLTFTPSVAGDYLIIATAKFVGPTGAQAQVRLVVDEVDQANASQQSSANSYYSFGAFRNVTLTAAQHSINLQLRDTGGAADASMKNARIYVIRLGQFAAAFGNESNAVATTSSTSLSSLHNNSYAPNEAASYLLFGTASIKHSATTSHPLVEMRNGSLLFSNYSVEPENANDFVTYFSIRNASLAAAEQADSIQWGVTAGTATARNARLLAIRIDDRVPPAMALIMPANNTWSNKTLINFTFNPSDNGFAISGCNLVVNGGANATNSTSVAEGQENNISATLTQGAHTWSVNCTDSSPLLNNGTNATAYSINVDHSSPNMTIFQPADGLVSIDRNVTFNFTAVDNLITNLSCGITINSQENSTNSSTSNNTPTLFAINNFNNGTYLYNVSCFDTAKNLNFSSTRTLYINISPLLSRVNATPNPIKGGNVITINTTGIDDPNNDTLTLYCSHNSTPTSANTNCTGGLTIDTSPPYAMNCTFATPANDASHTVFCRAYDGLSYSALRNTTYTTDSAPPSTLIISVAGDLNATYYDRVDDGFSNITIGGEAGMSCRVGTSDVPYSGMSNECSVGNAQANCSTTTATEGSDAHNFYVSCQDSLGNEQNSSQNNDVTSLVTDWTAPTTSDDSGAAMKAPPYSVIMAESDNVDGDPDTLYCTDASNSCAPGAAIDHGGTVQFTATNRGQSYLRYNSTDDAGNVQNTVNRTISINLLANFTNATDSVEIVKGGSTIAVTTNSSDADAGQTLQFFVCKTAIANSSGCSAAENTYCSNTTGTANSTCSFAAETDNSAHTWHAFIYDSFNESAFTNITGSYTTDSAAPSVTVINPANSTHTQNSVTATVSLSEAALWVGYSLDGAANVTMDMVTPTAWTAGVSGLSNGGHAITFYANDSLNNTGIAQRLFSIDAASGDTTPPTITVRAPSNGSHFNKSGTSVLLNITLDESGAWAGYSLDGGANVTMTNISLTSWNATVTGLADGLHNATFYANDSSSNRNAGASQATFFTADYNSPFALAFNTTPLTANNSANLTIYSHWNDTVGLSHAMVEENSTGAKVNRTINLTGKDDWANFTLTPSSLNPGQIAVAIYVNDTSGNFNTTSSLSIAILDVIPPLMNVTYSPVSFDEIDPNAVINITANVSDYSNASAVVLEFKQTTAEGWSNFTMTHTGGNAYRGNFTPSAAGNWSFRVYANDTAGNANRTANATLEVRLEASWAIIGFGSNESSGLLNANKTIGIFRINNTGDYQLEFDLSYTPATITAYYNQTEPFNVSSGEVRLIEVNVTALGSEAATSLSIKADPANATSQPDFAYANITFVSTADGAFMFITINKPQQGAAFTLGDSNINLSATVKNLGTQDATGTWLNWTLPQGWSNDSALERSIGFLGVGESAANSITADISSSAQTGTATLIATAGNVQNRNSSASREVTVNAATIQAGSDTAGGSASSGGGGGTAGSGRVSFSRTLQGRTETLNTSRTFELVSGQGDTFPVYITNIFSEGTLYNVTLFADGYLSQYLSIYPLQIDVIRPNATQKFDVTITSPAYLKQGTHQITFTITGQLIGVKEEKLPNGNKVTSYLKKDLIEKMAVTLIINEVSFEDSNSVLAAAKADYEMLLSSGLPYRTAQKLLAEAAAAMERKQYKTARDISSQISRLAAETLRVNELINDVRRTIEKKEAEGMPIVEGRKLLNLAIAAFEREDFEAATQRANNARLAIVIETKGRVNYARFVRERWQEILLSTAAAMALLYFLRNRAILTIISRRLEDLEKESVTIQQLISEAQEKTFAKKEMGEAEYHKQMYQYEQRLSEIRQLQSRLRSQKVGMIRAADEIARLKREGGLALEQLKKVQEDYYVRGSITKKRYEKLSEESRLRRAEIEKAIALLETRAAKAERLHREKSAAQKNAVKEKGSEKSVAIGGKSEILKRLAAHYNVGRISPAHRSSAHAKTAANGDIAALEAYGLKVKAEKHAHAIAVHSHHVSKHEIIRKLKEVHQNG